MHTFSINSNTSPKSVDRTQIRNGMHYNSGNSLRVLQVNIITTQINSLSTPLDGSNFMHTPYHDVSNTCGRASTTTKNASKCAEVRIE